MKTETIYVCGNCGVGHVQRKKPGRICCECSGWEKGTVVYEPKTRGV